LDQAASEEMGPQPIDSGPCEVGVIRRGHPIGQCRSRAGFALPLGLRPVWKRGLHDLVASWNGQFPTLRRLLERIDEVVPNLAAHTREKCRVSPELLTFPFGEGMVVALGTLHLDAEEEPGRTGRKILRLHFLGE